jgi:hypothetical protein
MPKRVLYSVLLAVTMIGCSQTRESSRDYPERCQVHDVATKADEVPIAYGLMAFQPGFLEARRSEFPNANSRVVGGCIIMEADRERVRYCDECRKAEASWPEEGA